MVSIPDRIRDVELSRRNRLVVYYAVSLVMLILLYTVLYNYGMVTLEGENHSIFRSFQTVVETMTTTGYGADSPWDSPVMNLFMVFMQLSGIAIGFFTLRVIIIPLFTGAEVNLDDRLTPKSDHVVVCEYQRDSAVLLDELDELGIDYVLVSSDREAAKDLSDQGYAAIHGSPQDAETLRRASIGAARAVVTDAGGANVNTILTVRTVRPDVEVITLTDDSDLREVLTDTGANTVLSPRAVLGHRLAQKAVSSLGAELQGTVELGEDIEVVEIPVPHGSPLSGVRIRESGIRERTGANVIGAWIDGELQLPPDPDAVISPNTVLLVTGRHGALEELTEFARPARSLRRPSNVVIAGFGEVGEAARDVLDREGIDVTTVDRDDGDGVDVVGDVGSRDVLREAGVEDAGAVVVGISDDSTALLTTVLARSMNPDVEILVRVNATDATNKALRGGADYVLSVPRISARMVASVLRGEDVLEPASQIRLVKVSAAPFAGSTLAGARIFERTGCRVVAVEDDSRQTTAVDPQRVFEPDDRITVVGDDEAVQSFLKRFDVEPGERPT